MSFTRLVSMPTAAQSKAWQEITWEELSTRFTKIDREFARQTNNHGSMLRGIGFTEQAAASLLSFHECDRVHILRDLKRLATNPYDPNSKKHKRIPGLRFIKSRYQHGLYHYNYRYFIDSKNKVVIDEVAPNRNFLQKKVNASSERPAMYEVYRNADNKHLRISKNMSYEQIAQLNTGWKTKEIVPVNQINTQFAAVNGMLNDLDKAMWLMGVHLDWAYRHLQFDRFTLIHNPTEKALCDLWECGWDIVGGTTFNANHLSAIMTQTQSRGLAVNWVAHSQGGIILENALKTILNRTNIRLSSQRMALHSIGTSVQQVQKLAFQTGLHISSVSNNPFDLVPNLLGRNDLSLGSFYRGGAFFNKVTGLVGGDAPAGVSPHTLPFMGIKSFYRILTEAGESRKAERVRNYMIKNQIAFN